MSQINKLLLKVLSGHSDKNIKFSEILKLTNRLGFSMRIKGDHHILYKDNISEIINIQPNKDGKAKSYQVSQVRNLIIKYKLEIE